MSADSQPKDNIPILTPPDNVIPQLHRGAGAYLWLWVALAAILLLGLAVILLLPKVMQPVQQLHVPAGPVIVAPEEAHDMANQTMQSYLQLRAQMELRNVSRWGEPEWSQSGLAAGKGARVLAERKFSEATQHYEMALQLLRQLESGRALRLSSALEKGQLALAQNRLDIAVQQFQLALDIEPDNRVAGDGLASSGLRSAVLQHMVKGENAEAEGNLLDARDAYQAAALLDSEYALSTTALHRVSEEIAGIAYQQAMTGTLTALDNGQLDAADESLAEASRLRPADPAVLDARQRLAQARRVLWLGAMRRQAATLERAEDWQGVRDIYKKILTDDSTAGFAHTGLDRAENRLQLNRQFDHYLSNPNRLFSAQPLSNAETLLSAITSVPADEPKLMQKLATLQHLVAQASTPVAISLNSDGQTNISIYHVGRLGSFMTRQLELLPGTYIVVGKRRGYRDIRKQLSVTPGRVNTTLTIQCEELI